MATVAQGYHGMERRKAPPAAPPSEKGWTLFLLLVTLMMVAGYELQKFGLYRAGDRIGYYMGVTGGVLMLPLLLYPFRKRLQSMSSWGLLPNWFKWHMALGVLGPAIIMLHTTFAINSTNAGVALVCTMLVSGSGIFGRFFYSKVHHGLYGRQISFGQLKEALESAGQVKSILSFAPEIERKLILFSDKAMVLSPVGKIGAWNFLTLGLRARWLARSLTRELEDIMYGDALLKDWNSLQMKRLDEIFYQDKAYIETYLDAVRDVAQFKTYEKLLSLWNLFHGPLVYVMVFSVVWHVIAVHMY